MNQIFFTCPSIDGHLGCFHVLAIISSAAMNIRVYASFWIKSFVWIYAQECDFPGSSGCKESAWNAGDPGLNSELGRSPGGGIGYSLQCFWASLVAQMVKNPPVIWDTWFHSQVGKIPWMRAWQPIPVFLPGEVYGQRSLVGYSPWGCKESDMVEWLSVFFTILHLS